MYKLAPHQIKFSNLLVQVLIKYKCAYLRGEVRSRKTGVVLQTANLYNAKNVLFLTKKKAISSIQSDYNNFGFTYDITVINYESQHKVKGVFDLIIYDESHCLGSFAKPAKRVKTIKDRFFNIPCIWLSGTPATESYSQFYHQFYVCKYNPFKNYSNFYKWSKDFVTVTEKRIGTHTIKDYSDANESKIEEIIHPYTVSMTQADAGFETSIKEHILTVYTPINLHNLVKRLLKEKAIEGKNGYIMGEMPAKLQSKVHQIYNGSVILEDHNGNSIPHIFSTFKADFIKERFEGKKIAIMYYYQAELEILKSVFKDNLTTDIDIFNSTNKNIALQQSSTEGMNVSKAECLVYYNFHFSGKNYIQSRDRLTVKDRPTNDVYFIIESPGINGDILKILRQKKDYNLESFYETTNKIKS